MRDRFAQDYVTVMIDTDRMTGGSELAKELRQGEDGGIPWSVILDADGQPLTTSDGPKGNVGCPAQPHEIDHFVQTMIATTARHMTADDQAIIERELRVYGAGLVSDRRKTPGYAAYTAAIADVKYGGFPAAVQSLGEALAAGYPPPSLPADVALRPLREDVDRRPEVAALIRAHVTVAAGALCDALEVGRSTRLEGRVLDDATGEPIAGALVELFHTDASGEYRPGLDAGGGAGNPRLRGFVKTDAEGRFTVDTIMPERYPNSSVPRHVHYVVRVAERPDFVSECFFASDPNLTAAARESAAENGFPIVALETAPDRRAVAPLSIRIPRP